MADYWTDPKIDWADTDGIGYADLNLIGANASANRDANINNVRGFGYTIDNSVSGQDGVITITGGSCYSEDGYPIRRDTSIVKNLNAWAQGSGVAVGGMAAAVTVAAVTWYYAFIIMDPTDGSTDVMFDSSPTGVNISSGVFTEKRLIGMFKTNLAGSYSSFLLMEMYSIGDYTYINPTFAYSSGTVFNNSAGIDNAYQTVILRSGLALPALEVRANLNIISDSCDYGLVSMVGTNFTIPGSLFTGGAYLGEFCFVRPSDVKSTMDLSIMIDSSNQIKLAMYGTAGGGSVEIRVRGFYYERVL